MTDDRWHAYVGLALALQLAAGVSAGAASDDLRLVDAAKRNEQAIVRMLLDEGLDVNARQADGATALLWSTYYDDADTVQLLLAAGADVNLANMYGESPLSLAIQNANDALVETLLSSGADAHAVKPTGETMLMTAARVGNDAIVERLLARGPDLDAKEHTKGQTALMLAAAHAHVEVVDLLLGAGADVNAASTGGSTALHFAVQQGDLDAAERLLKAGSDVHAEMTVRQIDQFTLGLVETLDGLTPLLLAITNCQRDGPEFFGSTEPHPVSLSCPANESLGIMFLERGADPNQPDGSRISPLHRAVQTGMADLVRALISHGADLNARVPPDARQWTGKNRGGARSISPLAIGATPYFIAAWTHRPAIMRILLDAGANPQLSANDNTTPLMAAAGVNPRPPMGYGRKLDTPQMLASVELALDAGADVNATNDDGQAPIHGAAKLKSTELIQQLVDHGAVVDIVDLEGRTPLSLAEEGDRYSYDEADESAAALLSKLASR